MNTMIKLRDDITLIEAVEEAIKRDPGGTFESASCWVYQMGLDIRDGEVRGDYPDSFYESPPIGSFGRFWIGTPPCSTRWGYLKAHHYDAWEVMHGDIRYTHFAPGLPTDVDKDGMPK